MKIIIILLFSFFSLIVQGQENVKLCIENQSNINNLILENKFFEAEKIFNQVVKSCPSANEKFYLNSEKIFNHNLEIAKNESEKTIAVKNLIRVYDLYDKKFPNNKNGNDIKKAIHLYDNNIGTKQEIFNILDRNFTTKKTGFVDPRLFYIYLELLIYKSVEVGSKIKTEDLISKFIEIDSRNSNIQKAINNNIFELTEKKKTEILSGIDETNLKNNSDDLLSYKTIQNATKKLLKPYLTCQNLNNYASSLYETNKNNDSWLKFVSDEMFSKYCLSNEMFAKVVVQSNLINPTSKSNLYLGYLFNSKNKFSESEQFFNESANLETNLIEKASIYFTIASTIYGTSNNIKAKEYIDKSIALNPNSGKSYLFLAQLYQSSIDDCAKTDFEKKAIYWLIASTTEKAGIAEPYLKNSTKKQADAFLLKVPNKAEISKSGLAGKTLTFDCFFNQTIEIPEN